MVLPAAVAEGLAPAAVVFQPPAQLHGELDAGQVAWVLLLFEEASATAEFSLPGRTVLETITQTRFASYDGPPAPTDNVPIGTSQTSTTTLHDPEGSVTFLEPASLYVEAESINLVLTNGSGVLRPTDPVCMAHLVPSGRWGDHVARYGQLCPAQGGTYIEAGSQAGNLGFSLRSETVKALEWHHTTVQCVSGCPSGGRRDEWRTPVDPTNSTLQNGVYEYERLAPGRPGTVMGGGRLAGALFGGPDLVANVKGTVRLPLASSAAACGQCAAPDDQTLRLTGNVTLQQFQRLPDGRMSGQVSGDIQGARFDERAIDPQLLIGAAAGVTVAGVIGLGVLFRIVGGLFARNTRPVLDHPRAKAIHDLIHRTPGLSFGQVRDTTGVGHGTATYHLRRLLKAGLIVAYQYKNSVRYYENHGRHKHDWQEYAALQKPELRQLHGWIAEHPRSSQLQVISAAAAWGWKRSTTQNRLRQLVEASLIRDHRTQVAVEYVAIRPSQAHLVAP